MRRLIDSNSGCHNSAIATPLNQPTPHQEPQLPTAETSPAPF
ncbi:hypothetical protein GXM_07645 [Nostoc sphaeroides CCNUC1]|uniref:Uncharacterized protein n=1 Tax=Nostoc sphaeroides CCNUC1 TaxID=2653204 RepID=A0A5P8WC73_9NOSO|nr:hypothetical protein GXM_07645 [Nostoc sphaeroides CCNUC1]